MSSEVGRERRLKRRGMRLGTRRVSASPPTTSAVATAAYMTNVSIITSPHRKRTNILIDGFAPARNGYALLQGVALVVAPASAYSVGSPVIARPQFAGDVVADVRGASQIGAAIVE